MYKFNGFTQKANIALNYAIQIAENMGHTYVGSEHLLIGLLGDSTSVAAMTMLNRNITEEKVLQAVKNIVGNGIPTRLTTANFTPRFKHIIENAIAISREMGQSYTGTENLLQAILSETDSCAANILSQLDVSVSELEGDLEKNFGSGHAQTENKKNKKGSNKTLDQYGRDLTEMAKNNKIDPRKK